MHADIAGEGVPVFIFIHGFAGYGGLWSWQTEYFKAYGRVITVDLPGHGRSPWRRETLAHMAGQVAHILDGVKASKDAVVVASSFGGLVALELYKARPDIFKAMVFAGSAPRFTSDEGFPAGLDPQRIAKLAAQLDADTGPVLEMFFRSLFTRQERESAQYPLIKGLRAQAPLASKDALAAFLEMLKCTDLRTTLGCVRVPVQFVLGHGDYICPPGIVAPLEAILPSARIKVMAGTGHFPFLSHPEEFNVLLRSFAG